MKKLALSLGVLLLACAKNEGSLASDAAGAGTSNDARGDGSGGTTQSGAKDASAALGGRPTVTQSRPGEMTRAVGGSSAGTRSGLGGTKATKPDPQIGGASGASTNVAAIGGMGSSTTGRTLATSSGGTANSGTSDVLGALERYLKLPRADRDPIDDQAFAQSPLNRDQVERAAALLWQDHVEFIEETRRAEHQAKTIVQGQLRLRYDFKIFGQKPAAGRSLFISLHGGGNAEPSVNDQQWENQKTLYQPDEGIYLAPRAPTDTWNLWHESHIDSMFDRLIANLIVLEQVNPDRVYVMGYSAGGDGVYQLGPRMADYWAAAAAMAGHPNDAKPDSLRNIGFTIHVGALDTAYDRNLVAQQWEEQLDAFQTADPSGYAHDVQVHAGKPHWMDLEDSVAVPWMADFTRNPFPSTIVWYQDDVPHTRFYWLAVEPKDAAAKTEVRATCVGQRITLETKGLTKLKLRLSDDLVDLDQPIDISANGHEQSPTNPTRRIAVLAKTLEERGDPRSVFSAEVDVQLSN